MINRQKVKVLLVEDCTEFREWFGDTLHKHFPVLEISNAGNCHRAMEIIERENQDLVFMDIRLPDGMGLDLTKKIKSKSLDSVVLMLTSSDTDEYREQAAESGANFFFSKRATSPNEIFRVVEGLIA